MKKIKYYSLKKIKSLNAIYNLILGMRANGKSFAVKDEVLKNAYLNNESFVYLRRWQEDIKRVNVTSYFADSPVEKITGGEYEGIDVYGSEIYFVNYEEDGKKIRGQKIGRACALNEAERYKSNAFQSEEKGLKTTDVIFEEVMSDFYLSNEPQRLMQFCSTVFRNKKGRVWLIGNTITRVCPYFREWGLKNALRQKPGTIDLYHYETKDGQVDIAVERCEVLDNREGAMFFGKAAEQIISGEWETQEVPHLLKPLEEYEFLYEVEVSCQDFRFCIQLLAEPEEGGKLLYIYPLTKDRFILRKISDTYSDSPFVSRGFLDRIKAERIMKELLKVGRVCYSDNLTGADFKAVLQFLDI